MFMPYPGVDVNFGAAGPEIIVVKIQRAYGE